MKKLLVELLIVITACNAKIMPNDVGPIKNCEDQFYIGKITKPGVAQGVAYGTWNEFIAGKVEVTGKDNIVRRFKIVPLVNTPMIQILVWQGNKKLKGDIWAQNIDQKYCEWLSIEGIIFANSNKDKIFIK